MALTCIFFVLALCFIAELKAATITIKSVSVRPTYVEQGKSLTLEVMYDYDGSKVVEVIWKRGINKLVEKDKFGDVTPVDRRASIKGNASLVLVNTTLNDNGTYYVDLNARDISIVRTTEFVVIIQVRPVANISCTTPVDLTEGENFSCICSGVGGSPPPTAYWLKDNDTKPMAKGYPSALLDIRNISKNDNGTYICRAQSGTLTKARRVNLTIFDKPVADVTCNTSVSIKEGKDFNCTCSGNDGSPPPSVMWLKDNNKLTTMDNILKLPNISKLDNGTYMCRVQSGNLKKEKRVDVTVLYKPTMISFTSNATKENAKLGDNVKLTCVATDGYPKPTTFRIMFNGTNVSSTGVLIIEKADSDNIGTYTCFASNAAGPTQKSLFLNVTETGGKTPAPSTTPTASTNSSDAPKKEESNIGLIAGTAAGGVVFLIICIVLIWYCCCKRSAGGSRKRRRGEEDIVANPSNDSMDRGNPYESVDQAKIARRPDDEAGPSNESPPDADNGLPPVYAVVDKSKKTPKPQPEKPPADSLTYASLDPVILQRDSSKMRDRAREDTTYASIDLEKLKDQE